MLGPGFQDLLLGQVNLEHGAFGTGDPLGSSLSRSPRFLGPAVCSVGLLELADFSGVMRRSPVEEAHVPSLPQRVGEIGQIGYSSPHREVCYRTVPFAFINTSWAIFAARMRELMRGCSMLGS
jgi:hypothetical protein